MLLKEDQSRLHSLLINDRFPKAGKPRSQALPRPSKSSLDKASISEPPSEAVVRLAELGCCSCLLNCKAILVVSAIMVPGIECFICCRIPTWSHLIRRTLNRSPRDVQLLRVHEQKEEKRPIKVSDYVRL